MDCLPMISSFTTLSCFNGGSLEDLHFSNTTESVRVPTSDHVAEIVGRQGRSKIKELRARTSTYIKTPVRDEDPVFIITGRKLDIEVAKQEILATANHFSQIRASRLYGSADTKDVSIQDCITIQVSVPYDVVGLIVGPKGATIKRIQQDTHTYIVTPSRDQKPIFQISGAVENVEEAKKEIKNYIWIRTGKNLPELNLNSISKQLTSSKSFSKPSKTSDMRLELQNNNIYNSNNNKCHTDYLYDQHLANLLKTSQSDDSPRSIHSMLRCHGSAGSGSIISASPPGSPHHHHHHHFGSPHHHHHHFGSPHHHFKIDDHLHARNQWI